MSLSLPQGLGLGTQPEEDSQARREEEGWDGVTRWGWKHRGMGSPPVPAASPGEPTRPAPPSPVQLPVLTGVSWDRPFTPRSPFPPLSPPFALVGASQLLPASPRVRV